jgi:hypothetical protein
MKKQWKKPLLLGVLAIVAVAVTLASVAIMLFRAAPTWYRPLAMDPQRREAAAQRATNKLAMIQNEAARLRRDERLAERAASTSTTSPATLAAPGRPITVSFTEDELNAFFDKWAVWNDWKSKYQRYIEDPVVLLDDGRIVIAAKVRDMNTVASLHFEPRVTEDGLLNLRLARILGGKLPLPEAVLSKYRTRMSDAMAQNLPRWQRTAAIDSGGTPNASAVAAAMGRLALHVLEHEPADPVLFLPLVDANLRPRSVAVRLTDVRIEDRTLTLTVEPMSGAQRAELLKRIREGSPVASASGP